MTYKKLLLTSSIALMSVGLFCVNNTSLAAALEPEWFNVPTKDRIGAPPAYKTDKSFEDYTYYMGKNSTKPLYLFKQTDGFNTYYSPVAHGQNISIQNKVTSEDQLRQNVTQVELKALQFPNDLTVAKYTSLKKYRVTKEGVAIDDAYRKNIKKSDNTVISGKYVGKVGEWRSLGYTTQGDIFPNPIFPADRVEKGLDLSNYPFRTKPWAAGIKEIGNGTIYDDEDNTFYQNKKRTAISALFKQYPELVDNARNKVGSNKAKQVQWAMNHLTLMTNPDNGETVIFGGASVYDGWYVILTIPSDQKKLRNLTTTKMQLLDANGNEVGTYTRDVSTGKSTMTKKRAIVAGETLTVKTTLLNRGSTTTRKNPTEIFVATAKPDDTKNKKVTNPSISDANSLTKKTVTASGTIASKESKEYTFKKGDKEWKAKLKYNSASKRVVFAK